jgi:hypothetical protein
MSETNDHSRTQLRWAIYGALITVAAAQMTGRILAVNSVDLTRLQKHRIDSELKKSRARLEAEGFSGETLDEKLGRRREELEERLQLVRPFLSGNDRSRWCTIRALVEHGTYAIDPIVTDPLQWPRWNTIDMVKHAQTGEPHLYSSKPTLLPTLLAGEYWVVRQITGWTLAEQPYEVVRVILLTVNVIPMILYFVLLAKLVERFGRTDWGRIFVMAAATFGTLLSVFAVALNNHLIAAVSASIALYAAVRIWYDGARSGWLFSVAGFFAAFTAANELPALVFFGLLGLGLLYKAPAKTLTWGLPAALIVVVAWFGTNYAAHRTFVPPYAHRAKGEDWQTGNWYNYSFHIGKREVQSYWKRDAEGMAKRSVVDRGEPSASRYALHCLVGHHGIFSLTPVWLLSAIGVALMLRNRSEPSLRPLGALICVATLVCLAFYLSMGAENRNYGGTSSALRWMMWFAPLWLVAMLPAADATASPRWRRILAAVLLAFSVISASYPTWNPWTHPWLAKWMDSMGWIEL